MSKNKEVKGNVKVFNKSINFDNLQDIDLISKHIEETLDRLRMKETLNIFDIDLDLIKESDGLFNQIHEAINEMKDDTLKDKFEVILNNNLIKTKEIKTNYRTICGCRISYDDLEKSISFIVREDDKPTYEQLEEEIKRLKQQNEFLMKQDNILQTLMQWIYSELNYDKNLYNPDSEEYRTGQKHYPDDTLDGFKIVIDKIIELKEEL